MLKLSDFGDLAKIRISGHPPSNESIVFGPKVIFSQLLIHHIINLI